MEANPEVNGSEAEIKRDLERVEADEHRLAEDVERLEHDLAEHAHGVTVEVNRTKIILATHRITGLELKQAAIDQGATLEIDFQLWRITGEHSRVQVPNDEELELHDGECFAANAPDDNA